MTKEDIRLMLRGRKVSRTSSEAVLEKLMHNERFINASTILLYYPLDDEVDVRPLLNCGKKTALPYIEKGKMDYSLYTGDLVKGAFGVMECRNKVPLHLDETCIALIPAVAFSPEGYRLGRGKGFYDRLFTQSQAVRIGVCFDFQLLDDIPTEPHDVPMHIVVTPSTTINLHNTNKSWL